MPSEKLVSCWPIARGGFQNSTFRPFVIIVCVSLTAHNVSEQQQQQQSIVCVIFPLNKTKRKEEEAWMEWERSPKKSFFFVSCDFEGERKTRLLAMLCVCLLLHALMMITVWIRAIILYVCM